MLKRIIGTIGAIGRRLTGTLEFFGDLLRVVTNARAYDAVLKELERAGGSSIQVAAMVTGARLFRDVLNRLDDPAAESKAAAHLAAALEAMAGPLSKQLAAELDQHARFMTDLEGIQYAAKRLAEIRGHVDGAAGQSS